MNSDQYIGAHAVVLYMYNSDFHDVVADLRWVAEVDYLLEKYELWKRSRLEFFGGLDPSNKRRFVQAALNKHSDSAIREAFVYERNRIDD